MSADTRPARWARLLAQFRLHMGREASGVAFAPGRVNLIGEHVDYHGGPVMPAALSRGVAVAWAPRLDRAVHALSLRANGSRAHPRVEFDLDAVGSARGRGDWGDYLRAAASMASGAAEPGPPARGLDLVVSSDLPEASGLSSSSALVVAAGLAMLEAGGRLGALTNAGRLDLAAAFARAERFVGTEGGGMDQAASLGGREGSALRIDFDPLRWRPVPIPASVRFIVAHTGVRAEKSGAAQARYNEIRASRQRPEVAAHVESEIERVGAFESALASGDLNACGALMDASHASLRDRLGVSHPALDHLAEVARASGARGARMTGAGFGGSIVALVEASGVDSVMGTLREAQTSLPCAEPAFVATPGPGARVWMADG